MIIPTIQVSIITTIAAVRQLTTITTTITTVAVIITTVIVTVTCAVITVPCVVPPHYGAQVRSTVPGSLPGFMCSKMPWIISLTLSSMTFIWALCTSAILLSWTPSSFILSP